ncbi:hypothetical protein CQ018_18555 [Arthrobacter sp. MYb227]|uniref:hypothetical protein n=1 Tax=Arthrobacter sp. MYb227 TaxID=1848601 RepID=UPI000CFABB24|nr:hypothetical protein [Arthrobacter sp. MYb227]PQZ86682.1 hypothetical protein CQ018_18555 [Arthrobacter sp. MYb227]
MPAVAKNLPTWVSDLALLRDRHITRDDTQELHSRGDSATDSEVMRWWPAESDSTDSDSLVSHQLGTKLSLLGSPNEAFAAQLASAGWQLTEHQVLLAAATKDVEQTASLPETATLFDAPMDDYDVLEIADFDAPVARGRIRFGEGFALLCEPVITATKNTEIFRHAIIANLAASATRQGLAWLFMVTSADSPSGTRTQRGSGWSNATLITTYTLH